MQVRPSLPGPAAEQGGPGRGICPVAQCENRNDRPSLRLPSVAWAPSEPALQTPPQAPAQSRCLRLRCSAPGCGPSRLPLARDVGGLSTARTGIFHPARAWEQCSLEPQTPTAARALPPGACVPTHLPQLLAEAPAPRQQSRHRPGGCLQLRTGILRLGFRPETSAISLGRWEGLLRALWFPDGSEEIETTMAQAGLSP